LAVWEWILDQEGMIRRDLETVKREAFASAPDLIVHGVGNGELDLAEAIAVNDEIGGSP
jgi:hypothetical protein